jgi:hypothetical protein
MSLIYSATLSSCESLMKKGTFLTCNRSLRISFPLNLFYSNSQIPLQGIGKPIYWGLSQHCYPFKNPSRTGPCNSLGNNFTSGRTYLVPKWVQSTWTLPNLLCFLKFYPDNILKSFCSFKMLFSFFFFHQKL